MNIQTNKGFTLIELVIAIAIVGILASIAYPSYTEQVRKSRRGDCAAELVLFANQIERFATARGTYVGAGAVPPNCTVGGTLSYNFAVVASTASTFTISAAPVGPQATDKCGTLTLTNTGIKNMIGATGGLTVQNCW